MASVLEPRWQALCRRVGVTDTGGAVFSDLQRRYSERHRAYHNLAHLRHGFVEMDRCSRQIFPSVEFAWWFHDAVYSPRSHDNEEQSAALAESALRSLGVSTRLITTISALVVATKHTAPPSGTMSRLLVDIDLSILGQSRLRFRRYEAQIRREYSWVPWPRYVDGRSAVLREFLSRPSVFFTREFRVRYESAARKNLEASLRLLSRLPQPTQMRRGA